MRANVGSPELARVRDDEPDFLIQDQLVMAIATPLQMA